MCSSDDSAPAEHSPADWQPAPSQYAALACRHGYERELLSLLSQLVRDMNRKIEKQKERAVLESGARQLTMEDRARLEAIKVRGVCGSRSLMWPLSLHQHCWFTRGAGGHQGEGCVCGVADP